MEPRASVSSYPNNKSTTIARIDSRYLHQGPLDTQQASHHWEFTSRRAWPQWVKTTTSQLLNSSHLSALRTTRINATVKNLKKQEVPIGRSKRSGQIKREGAEIKNAPTASNKGNRTKRSKRPHDRGQIGGSGF